MRPFRDLSDAGEQKNNTLIEMNSSAVLNRRMRCLIKTKKNTIIVIAVLVLLETLVLGKPDCLSGNAEQLRALY